MGFFDSLTSSIGGGLFGLGEKFLEREWAKEDASKTRNWMEKLRATQHQVEVGDLRKAGLNPVLSAGGTGAGVAGSVMERPTQTSGSMIKGLESMANIKNINGIAEQNKAQGQLDKWMIQYLKKNPQLVDMVVGGRLSTNAGVPGWLGVPIEKIKDFFKYLTENKASSNTPMIHMRPVDKDYKKKSKKVDSMTGQKFDINEFEQGKNGTWRRKK